MTDLFLKAQRLSLYIFYFGVNYSFKICSDLDDACKKTQYNFRKSHEVVAFQARSDISFMVYLKIVSGD